MWRGGQRGRKGLGVIVGGAGGALRVILGVWAAGTLAAGAGPVRRFNPALGSYFEKQKRRVCRQT